MWIVEAVTYVPSQPLQSRRRTRARLEAEGEDVPLQFYDLVFTPFARADGHPSDALANAAAYWANARRPYPEGGFVLSPARAGVPTRTPPLPYV